VEWISAWRHREAGGLTEQGWPVLVLSWQCVTEDLHRWWNIMCPITGSHWWGISMFGAKEGRVVTSLQREWARIGLSAIVATQAVLELKDSKSIRIISRSPGWKGTCRLGSGGRGRSIVGFLHTYHGLFSWLKLALQDSLLQYFKSRYYAFKKDLGKNGEPGIVTGNYETHWRHSSKTSSNIVKHNSRPPNHNSSKLLLLVTTVSP